MAIFLLTSDHFGYRFPFDNLPTNLRLDLNSILNVVDGHNYSTLQDVHFRKAGGLIESIESIDETRHPASKIAKSILKQLRALDNNVVTVFADNSLRYDQLVRLKQATRWIVSGHSLFEYFIRKGAEDQLFRETGYSVSIFEDLGFDYTVGDVQSRCRFCGRSTYDGATFIKDAHAISYFLGNHHLLGSGECDDCNEKFGHELEPHLMRYYHPTMIHEGFTGRGSNPHIKGGTFRQQLDRHEYYPDETEAVPLKQMSDGVINRMDLTLSDDQAVIKARIYRILCKYAISLLPDTELSNFQRTIRWINRRSGGSKRIPSIYRYEKLPLIESPILSILTPLKWTPERIRCIVIFRFITNLWVYALPFAQGDRYELADKELQRIIQGLGLDKSEPFVKESFSTERKTYTNTHFSIEIGKDAKLTRLCDMSPEEQETFMAEAKGLSRTTIVIKKE